MLLDTMKGFVARAVTTGEHAPDVLANILAVASNAVRQVEPGGVVPTEIVDSMDLHTGGALTAHAANEWAHPDDDAGKINPPAGAVVPPLPLTTPDAAEPIHPDQAPFGGIPDNATPQSAATLNLDGHSGEAEPAANYLGTEVDISNPQPAMVQPAMGEDAAATVEGDAAVHQSQALPATEIDPGEGSGSLGEAGTHKIHEAPIPGADPEAAAGHDPARS